MTFLIIKIEGVFMSFGEGDYWDIRGTNSFPTKSFIVGLLAAGLGYQRNEQEKIRKISDGIIFACREDKNPSIMRDFHTILDTMQADGKRNINPVVSPRHYLTDGSFTIIIGLKNEVLKKDLIQALKDPVWPPYLGRKCCIPSKPLYLGEINAENEYKAFKKIPPQLSDNKTAVYSCMDETNKQGRKSIIKDDVFSFEPRIYKNRIVYFYAISYSKEE